MRAVSTAWKYFYGVEGYCEVVLKLPADPLPTRAVGSVAALPRFATTPIQPCRTMRLRGAQGRCSICDGREGLGEVADAGRAVVVLLRHTVWKVVRKPQGAILNLES